MSAHHTLEAYLDTYTEAAGIRDGSKTPLFRSAAGRTGTLTDKPMNRVDAWRMIQRRAAELGMRIKIGCHTFRATGITAYLEAGGTLENAQLMASSRESAHDQALRPHRRRDYAGRGGTDIHLMVSVPMQADDGQILAHVSMTRIGPRRWFGVVASRVVFGGNHRSARQ